MAKWTNDTNPRAPILDTVASCCRMHGMPKKRTPDVQPLSDQLRQIIRDAPVSRYQISKATGIAESTLSRFLSGERDGFAPWTLDELGRYLRLTITSAGPVENE